MKAAASLKRNPAPSDLATIMARGIPGGGRNTKGEQCQRLVLAAGPENEKGRRHKREAKRKELNSFSKLRIFQTFYFLLLSCTQHFLLRDLLRDVFF